MIDLLHQLCLEQGGCYPGLPVFEYQSVNITYGGYKPTEKRGKSSFWCEVHFGLIMHARSHIKVMNNSQEIFWSLTTTNKRNIDIRIFEKEGFATLFLADREQFFWFSFP